MIHRSNKIRRKAIAKCPRASKLMDTSHIYYRSTLVCSKSTAVFYAPLSRYQQRINLQSSALQRTTFKYRNIWKLGKWNLRGVESVLYALFFPLNLYVILSVICKIYNRQLFKKNCFSRTVYFNM